MADDSYSEINKSLVENKTYYELENVDRKDNLKTLTTVSYTHLDVYKRQSLDSISIFCNDV